MSRPAHTCIPSHLRRPSESESFFAGPPRATAAWSRLPGHGCLVTAAERRFVTVEGLAGELLRLARDPEAYAAMHAWRRWRTGYGI